MDVSEFYEQKIAPLPLYKSVFCRNQAELLDCFSAKERYVGSLEGCALEAFKTRSPFLLHDPTVVAPVRFG